MRELRLMLADTESRTSFKAEALLALADRVRREAPSGKKPVLGEGAPDARLMIIGEAPGKEEEASGRPFVGPAGRLLNSLLAQVGINRSETWITNLVKWRPTVEKSGMLLTTAPRVADVHLAVDWLFDEIRIIGPRIILCLGNFAARSVTNKRFSMTKDHGSWLPGPMDTQVIATFHPAYPIRAGGAGEPIIRMMLSDLLTLRARYDQIK